MSEPSGSHRAIFRRETLLKKLSAVVTQLPQLDLPATIRAIYAFGGVLREKERLHDVDVVCLFSQTPEQSQRWETFRKNFNNISHGSEGSPIGRLRHLLDPYYENRVRLAQAVQDEDLLRDLAARGVEPKWAGCFSWTEVLHNSLGFFYPSIEIVLQRLLFKGAKGVSVILVRYDEFVEGRSGYSHLNTVLAWSPERSDINANLFGRGPEERKRLLLQELRKFSDAISDTKGRYTELRSEIVKGPLKLNFEALERNHPEIQYNEDLLYGELLTRCEQARNEIRRYEEEVAVLSTVRSVILRLTEQKPVLENPLEEQIAQLTLLWQPKYHVKERRIRELLRTLGLPEDKVKTIKIPGNRTDYELVDMRFRFGK